MTRIITALAEVAPRYGALFCDLWGCVHNGIAPCPASFPRCAPSRRRRPGDPGHQCPAPETQRDPAA